MRQKFGTDVLQLSDSCEKEWFLNIYIALPKQRKQTASSQCPWLPLAQEIASDKEEVILEEMGCRLIET